MTVSSETSRVTFAGNGVTTSFSTSPMVFFSSSDLTVYVVTTATGVVLATLVLNTNYTVSGGSGSTGTLNLAAGSSPYGAPATGTTLVIVRDVAATQSSDLVNNDGSDAEVLEDALDRLTMLTQQLETSIGRSFKLADSDVTGASTTIPALGDRASKVLGFGADGGIVMYVPASAVTESSSVTFVQPGSGAIGDSVQEALRNGVASVMGWIPVSLRAAIRAGTSTTDVSTYINNAITDVGSGGALYFPAGRYYTTAFLNAEGLRGLHLMGPSGQFGFNGARIYAAHTGKAILSLVGSLYCRIDNLILEGDSSSKPKTGLLLGRASAASASNHTFVNLRVQGNYSVAGVYNVASEENNWVNCYIKPTAAPYAGLYMSQADGQIATIGGLTSSSCEGNNFFGGVIGNEDTTAGSSAVYLDCGASFGHHHFYSVFLPKEGGDSYIYVKLGGVDGLDTEFPIGFHNCFAESTDGPTTGLHFVAATTKILSGFTAKNLRLQTPDTNNILCDGGGTVYLVGADISTPYRSTSGKPSTFHRCDSSSLNLLSESSVTVATLVGSTLAHNSSVTITTDTNNIIRDLGGTAFQLPALTKRLKAGQGAVVASANNLALGSDGNRFRISGTTQINLIDSTGWPGGSEITLHFQAALTVKHLQSASGANKPLVLAGGVDFSAGADDQITLQYDATDAAWFEKCRTVI